MHQLKLLATFCSLICWSFSLAADPIAPSTNLSSGSVEGTNSKMITKCGVCATHENSENSISASAPIVPSNILVAANLGTLAITPDGKKGYMGDSLNDSVAVLDLTSNTIVNTIVFPAGSGPYGSTVLPNGTTAYVANVYNDTVTVIDVVTDEIITTVAFPSGSGPFLAAATPDCKTVNVANLYTNNVIPIDVATNTAGSPFTFAFGGGSSNAVVEHLRGVPPSPPIYLRGSQKSYRLPTQTDIVNTITWYAPFDEEPPVYYYRVYRDENLTDLIGLIGANEPLIFEDHFRRKNLIYTYYIVSVSLDGTFSTPASIMVFPKR